MLNGMHTTRLEASLCFLTHVLKIFSAREENKGVYSVSTTVRLVCLFGKWISLWHISGRNRPVRAPSWHSFPSPVFPTYLTFFLSSQHHRFMGRQVLGTQSATALHPSWSHQLLPSLLPNAPMLSALVHASRFAELLLALALQSVRGSSATIAAVFYKLLPTLLRTSSPPDPRALHQPGGWGAAVLHRPGKAILFHPHLQLVLGIRPEINLLHFDFMFSLFLSPGWDGSFMLF